MGFQVSPGIQVKEIDQTNSVPKNSANIGAAVGYFDWGPTGQIVQVASETQLVTAMGKPTEKIISDFLPLTNFLKYSNTLNIVRNSHDLDSAAHASNRSGAGKNEDKPSIGNAIEFESYASGHFNNAGAPANNSELTYFIAKYKGSKGNALSVAIVGANTTAWQNFGYKEQFSGIPTSSAFALKHGGSNDGLHALVIDETGEFTGSKGAVLETFPYMSQFSDAVDAQGASIYWRDVMNSGSKYIWVGDAPADVRTGGTSGVGKSVDMPLKSINASLVVRPASAEVVAVDGVDAVPGVDAVLASPEEVDSDGNVTKIAVEAVTGHPAVAAIPAIEYKAAVPATYWNHDGTPYASGYPTAYWPDDLSSDLASEVDAKSGLFSLYSGTSYATIPSASPKDADYSEALNVIKNVDLVDIDLIIGGACDPDLATIYTNFVSTRMDCLAFLSPKENGTAPINLNVDKVVEWADKVPSSSFIVLDSTPIKVYDRYFDKYRFVAASGDVAGIVARTERHSDAWMSPAGFNRGVMKNVVALGINPDQTQRDRLYQRRVNPITSFPGHGFVLFGDKTGLGVELNSAFNRINVRRLFIVLERAIKKASRAQLFEFNDEFSRAQFRNMVEPFLREIKGRRGVYDYMVVCDDSNNGGSIVDANEFVADIYIKPSKSINYITLNFIATRSGVEFSEIVGK